MMVASTENQVFLSTLLSAIRGAPEADTGCGDVLYDADTISISELCEWLETLTGNSTALERMSRSFRYREWSNFYDYIKNLEIGVDLWPSPSFDAHLVFLFCNLVWLVYEHTNIVDFAYLYARILFDVAYEEIHEESLLDGIYTAVYQKVDKAVAALVSAWKKAPSRTTFTRVLWGYRHKRQCLSLEYSDGRLLEKHSAPQVDEEIREFLKSEEVTEEYLQLPDSIQLLQLIDR